MSIALFSPIDFAVIIYIDTLPVALSNRQNKSIPLLPRMMLRSQDPSKRAIHEYLQQDYEQDRQLGDGSQPAPMYIEEFGTADAEPLEDEFDLVENNHQGADPAELRNAQSIVFIMIGAAVLVAAVAMSMLLSPPVTSGDSGGIKSASFVSEEIMAFKASGTIEDAVNGVVSSDHPLCSHMGLATLQKGGNAVDAAVVTALCLGVANPASSGIGGGAFIVMSVNTSVDKSRNNSTEPEYIDARDPNFKQPVPGKILEVIDCREVAPLAASKNMFNGLPEESSTIGGLAIAVPGELRGLELAHARYGKLPWAALVKPVHALAKNGVPVFPYLEKAIREHTSERWRFDNLKNLLTKHNHGEQMLKQGDLLYNFALAGTLDAIMQNGVDALYKGGRTAHFIEDIQAAGGIITAEDLRLYKPTIRDPLVGRNVDGFTMVGAPPPSSGGAAVIGAARFLSGYNKDARNSPSEHRLLEAMKHAFSIRMSLNDPAFHERVNVTDAVEDLVYNGYMETLRKATFDHKVLPLSQYGGTKWAQLNDAAGQGDGKDANEGDRKRRLRLRDAQNPNFGYLEDHGTTHMSVVDAEYNAVSITSSVNTYFGSGIVSKHTGVLLNSQMDDFSTPGRPNFFGLDPSPGNFIRPGKKPLSSMSPMLIYREKETGDGSTTVGDLAMALGASGGPKIITAVLQTFINYAVKRMPLFEAVAHPRLHDQLLYHGTASALYEQTTIGTADIEVDEKTRQALINAGHKLLAIEYTGAVQVVALDNVTYRMDAVSDFRKGGKPAGY